MSHFCTFHMFVYNNKSEGANIGTYVSVHIATIYVCELLCNNRSIKSEII